MGDEVLATYGAHSNDKLLVHYGFICASTMQHASPDDEVRLDHVIISRMKPNHNCRMSDFLVVMRSYLPSIPAPASLPMMIPGGFAAVKIADSPGNSASKRKSPCVPSC
jgi:hypothetical protein